jgi:hypothetical protein
MRLKRFNFKDFTQIHYFLIGSDNSNERGAVVIVEW